MSGDPRTSLYYASEVSIKGADRWRCTPCLGRLRIGRTRAFTTFCLKLKRNCEEVLLRRSRDLDGIGL